MRTLFVLLLSVVSGCGMQDDAVPISSYLFSASEDPTSTCPANRQEVKYIFKIESAETISIDFKIPQVLTGTISADAFDVSGDNVLDTNQTITFSTDSIVAGEATSVSSYKINPFCFTSFVGTFVPVD